MLPANDPVPAPPPIWSVPADTVESPVKVLLPVRMRVPAPSFSSVLPGPAIPEASVTSSPLVSSLMVCPPEPSKRDE